VDSLCENGTLAGRKHEHCSSYTLKQSVLARVRDRDHLYTEEVAAERRVVGCRGTFAVADSLFEVSLTYINHCKSR
jgi:hypothetical protein